MCSVICVYGVVNSEVGCCAAVMKVAVCTLFTWSLDFNGVEEASHAGPVNVATANGYAVASYLAPTLPRPLACETSSNLRHDS